MKVKVYKNYQELSIDAAKEIINQVRTNPKSIIGFATGSSPVGLYKEMISDYKINHTSYKDIKTFNLDEYFGIDKTHPQSYYQFMMNNLFSHIDVNPENINIPSGVVTDINVECDAYNKKLSQNIIDIQILGVGGNGHIGFNEPGTSFDSVTHHVKLDEKTRKDNARFFNSIDEVPKYAITMGIKNILSTRKIILIATGINKSDAVYHMVKGDVTPVWPATALQMHDDVTIYVDEEAASKL